LQSDEDRKQVKKQHYLKNREKYIELQKKKYKDFSSIFMSWKSNLSCCVCGEKETICLDFHHINPEEKEKTITKLTASGYNSVIKELKKCVVVCANCHRKIHANKIDFEIKENLSENFEEYYSSSGH